MFAQTASLSVASKGVCSSGYLYVPLIGKNLSNVGAITLYINYNGSRLLFQSIENVDPQIDGVLYNVLNNPSRISLVWSDTDGASFSDEKLLDFKFLVINNSEDIISFAIDSCEIADASIPPQILPVAFVNGVLAPGDVSIQEQPENRTVPSQANTSFTVVSANADQYLWQKSTDAGLSWDPLSDGPHFNGSDSHVLQVLNIPTSFDGNRFRCLVSRGDCFAFSLEAKLEVDTSSSIDDSPFFDQWFSLVPNPVSDHSKLEFSVPGPGIAFFMVYNSAGIRICDFSKDFSHQGKYKIEMNCVSLPVGLYQVHAFFQTNGKVINRYTKFIKI